MVKLMIHINRKQQLLMNYEDELADQEHKFNIINRIQLQDSLQTVQRKRLECLSISFEPDK